MSSRGAPSVPKPRNSIGANFGSCGSYSGAQPARHFEQLRRIGLPAAVSLLFHAPLTLL
jgi:hypothetical protein